MDEKKWLEMFEAAMKQSQDLILLHKEYTRLKHPLGKSKKSVDIWIRYKQFTTLN